MLTGAVLAFVVNIVGAVINWSFVKIGRKATQACLFVIALGVALYYHYAPGFPGLVEWVGTAGIIFSAAVAIYEVFLNQFPVFSGPSVPLNTPVETPQV